MGDGQQDAHPDEEAAEDAAHRALTRGLRVSRARPPAAAAKTNHMTMTSMTMIVAPRTRYWVSSGRSARMNCGVKARKNTTALGLVRLTSSPRLAIDHAGSGRSGTSRRGSGSDGSGAGAQLADAEVDEVGGSGIPDQAEGDR